MKSKISMMVAVVAFVFGTMVSQAIALPWKTGQSEMPLVLPGSPNYFVSADHITDNGWVVGSARSVDGSLPGYRADADYYDWFWDGSKWCWFNYPDYMDDPAVLDINSSGTILISYTDRTDGQYKSRFLRYYFLDWLKRLSANGIPNPAGDAACNPPKK